MFGGPIVWKKLVMASVFLVCTPACLLLDGPVLWDSPEPGYTECGDFVSNGTVYCTPNQYCEDPTFSECALGCLSNDNCADDQRCVKSDGTDIGTCQAKVKIREPGSRAGLTPCGEKFGEEVTCQPGSYCESSVFSNCDPGCLSDANCLTNQTCDKSSGEQVGICR